jgi:hypothetical protein
MDMVVLAIAALLGVATWGLIQACAALKESP